MRSFWKKDYVAASAFTVLAAASLLLTVELQISPQYMGFLLSTLLILLALYNWARVGGNYDALRDSNELKQEAKSNAMLEKSEAELKEPTLQEIEAPAENVPLSAMQPSSEESSIAKGESESISAGPTQNAAENVSVGIELSAGVTEKSADKSENRENAVAPRETKGKREHARVKRSSIRKGKVKKAVKKEEAMA